MDLTVETLLRETQDELELQLVAGHAGQQRRIENTRIQKPGLAIAGLVEAIRPGRVQVFGNTEIQYLRGLDSSNQRAALAGLFAAHIPCVVVTTGLISPLDLLQAAQTHAVPLLTTPLTSGTFIRRIHPFFDEKISPEVILHGVLVDVFGVGMLLSGQSGIGKSECALDLILRGHRLVADDVVLVRQYDRELMGMNTPLTKHHMEVRGLGIINVRDLFGAASVC